MPLYDYHCKNCGENTEILQKHSDLPEKMCPHCHQDKLEKQISAPQFQLKGTGWYVTDFKNQKENKPATGKTEKTDVPSSSTDKTEPTKTEIVKNPEKSE